MQSSNDFLIYKILSQNLIDSFSYNNMCGVCVVFKYYGKMIKGVTKKNNLRESSHCYCKLLLMRSSTYKHSTTANPGYSRQTIVILSIKMSPTVSLCFVQRGDRNNATTTSTTTATTTPAMSLVVFGPLNFSLAKLTNCYYL